jgi:hypothetical protein
MSGAQQPSLFDDLPDPGAAAAPKAVAAPQPVYHEEFGWIVPPPPGGHTPETIRALMHDILAEVRVAGRMPWNARKLRSNTAMFPYMAEWLKGGEGEQLMLDFKAEMDRLEAPVDQVAPNWRRIWGLAA